MVYFEKLSIKSYFLFYLKNSSVKQMSTIFFIDASISAKAILIPILNFFGKKICQLNFQMMEIVDKNS